MSADLMLTADEDADFAAYEETIRSGLRTFVEVGEALANIRDRKLYRQTHLTFEAYCEQQWSLSRSRVYQMIDAAQTVTSVSTIVDTPLPANEGQARELAGLEPETAAQVMQAAADAGPVTARSIAEHREQIAPKPSKFTKLHNDVLVNKETGEVIGGNLPPISEGVDATDLVENGQPDPVAEIAADPEYQRLDLQEQLMGHVTRARRGILAYSPAEIAERAEPAVIDALDELAKSFQVFAAEVHKHRPGLRIVGRYQ